MELLPSSKTGCQASQLSRSTQLLPFTVQGPGSHISLQLQHQIKFTARFRDLLATLSLSLV